MFGGLLHELASGFTWRLAHALHPIVRDRLNHWVWCSPRTGIVGVCSPTHGRCATCKRVRS